MESFISFPSCCDKKTVQFPFIKLHEELNDIYELNDKELINADLFLDDPKIKSLFEEIHEKIQLLSSTPNKKTYYSCLYIYYNNLAYYYHKNDQSVEVEYAVQNSIKNFQSLQGFLSTRQQNVAYIVELIKIYLQSCAIFSQGGKHKLSLFYAEKSLEKLLQAFRILRAICQDELSFVANRDIDIVTKENYPKIQKVFFQTRVLKDAKKLLDEASNFPLVHKLLLEEKEHFCKIINNIYFWKNNFSTNEKIIRKQLDIDKVNVKRNILGLPKVSEMVEKFHIGSLMSLQMKKMSLNLKSDKYYLLSEERLLEMVLYVSVCYFTLGTQTRFDELEDDVENLNILEKYKKLGDTKINICKILHLKSIEIAGKYLPTSNQYFNHLLYSFNKNYKTVLDQIVQVSQYPSAINHQKRSNDFDEPSHEYGIVRSSKKGWKQKLVEFRQPLKLTMVMQTKSKAKGNRKRNKRMVSCKKVNLHK